jgi:hypothetical protein
MRCGRGEICNGRELFAIQAGFEVLPGVGVFGLYDFFRGTAGDFKTKFSGPNEKYWL